MADENTDAPVDETATDVTEQDDQQDDSTPDPKDPEFLLRQSRKHERRWKEERKAREQLQRQIEERENAQKSDLEKALEQARQEARQSALAEAEQERRADRLEVTVTRLAARELQIGDGTARFADPEDALLHIQHAITAGDLDAEDIFDGNGKVDSEVVQTALAQLLDRKPHLRAGDQGPARVQGGSDAGRGGTGKSLEDESVDEIFARKRKHKAA